LQLKDLGRPLVVVINMWDQLPARHMVIDLAYLQTHLGVPVIAVSAQTGSQLDALQDLLGRDFDKPTPRFSGVLGTSLDAAEALLWHEEDLQTIKKAGKAPAVGSRETLYVQRRQEADALAVAAMTRYGRSTRPSFSQRIDAVLFTPWGGLISIALVVALLYYGVGVLVADHVVEWMESGITHAVLPILRQRLLRIFPLHSIGFQMVLGPYGMISSGLIYIVGLLLPLVAGFYLILAFLEDSGYLPRLAALLDRWFLRIGLNGRAVVPLVLGFGCVTLASLTTRILGSERERRIATVLLAWTIPCSAQLGVVIGLLSGLGFQYAALYALTIVGIFILVGTIADHTLPGKATPLLLDLPPLRRPSIMAAVKKTRFRVTEFLKEAAPLFVLGAGIIQAATLAGFMERIDKAAGPAFHWWLKLPASSVSAFLLGFLRRDFGVADLSRRGLDPHQIVTGAVTLTLFVPCIASTLVIYKERGAWWGTFIWMGSVVLALGTGAVIARIPMG
ncbi:MAG: ferrous iron transport protein B, partial [Firmicutes bacterium]|nr:ferrous iron transport protein B [Bacillota bacterium]